MVTAARIINAAKLQRSRTGSVLRSAPVCLLALCVLLNSGASAKNNVWSQFVNATKLMSFCRRVEATQQAICDAYIAGVYDALSATNDIFEDKRRIAGCAGKRISINDVKSAFMIEYKRKFGKLPASRLVIDGLARHVCIDSEKLNGRIKKELGPPPKGGTAGARRYYLLYSCMYKLNTSKLECEKIIK